MAKRLVPIAGLGDAGWLPDQAGYELAPNALTALQNMRMRNGWAERVHGYRAIFTAASDTPRFLIAYPTALGRDLVHATRNQVFVDDNTARFNISPAGQSVVASNAWTGALLSGVLALNNGTDAPWVWTGNTGSPLAALPGWDATWRARALRTTRFHLVAFGMTEGGVSYPQKLRWSDAAIPGSVPAQWAPTVTNEASFVDVPGDGVAVDMLPFGADLVLYKGNATAQSGSMALMSWVGAPNYFSITPLPDPVGMLAPNCGVMVPGVGHVVLTPSGDVMRHALNGASSILDGKTRDWLIAQIDFANAGACFVAANYPRSEVWICFPEQGQTACTKALIWNWKSDTFGKADLPSVTFGTSGATSVANTAFDAATTSFDAAAGIYDSGGETLANNNAQLLMAGGTSLYMMDSTDLANGATFTGSLERTGLHLDAPERLKTVSRVWLQVDAAAGAQVNVSVGVSDDPASAPSYQPAVAFTVGTDQWVNVNFPTGRFLAYQLASSSWFRVRSLKLEVRTAGAY